MDFQVRSRMTTEKTPDPAVAERALQEARMRREQERDLSLPSEKGGPRGAEPVRYGDWEKDGIAYDF